MANTITFPPVSGGGGGGTGDAAWGSITGVLNTQVDLRNALNGKQATLISGTNIKTINGQDILGSGELTIEVESDVDLSEYYKKTETYNKTEVDDLIANSGVTLAQTTGSGTDVIMSQKAVSDRIQYTNLNPVPTAIGGVQAGTTFNKTPIIDILNSLLYPYQNPSFSSFSIDGQSSGSFELGYTYPSGNKLFAWNIINPNNVKENSITLNAEAGVSNTGSKSQMVASITKNTAGSHTFTIKAQNSNNVEFSRTITFNWLAKRFWGVSEEESVTDDIIKSFSSELSNSRVKTVSYDGTGGRYPYFIYPTARTIHESKHPWNRNNRYRFKG
jgi:hypothetical protein